MAIIFNSKDLNITEQQMEILYRENLIKCNDYTLEVATIPNWAIGEAESIVNKKFVGTEIDDKFAPGNKIDMKDITHSNLLRVKDDKTEETHIIVVKKLS